MAIPNPDHLLEQAEYLLQARNSLGRVRQADRRRAISAAYYAVFHFALTAVADEFIGKAERNEPRYALVYRSIDHKALEGVCDAVGKERLPKNYEKYAPKDGVGPNIREFAILTAQLKAERLSADYDPSHWVNMIDAMTAISMARSAMLRFSKASLARRKAFLTLLLFKPRS